MSVVERARIVRVPSEAQLQRALSALLEAPAAPPGLSRRRSPGFRGRARSRFRIRTTPAPRGDAGLAAGVPGSGSAAATSTGSADTGPDASGDRTDPAGGSPERARPTRPGSRRRRRPPRRPSPRPRSLTQDGTGTAAVVAADEPRLARQPAVRFDRPQLAAQARGHRARDAAVRGPRRLPGQQRVPGSRARAPPSTSPTGRSSPTTCATSTRSGTSRRSTSVGCAPRTSRRPSTSPTSSPTASSVNVRVAVSAVDPRVTILDSQPRSIQVVLDEVTTKQVPVDVQQGPTPPGVDVGEMTYTPTEVTVTGASTAVSRVVAARVIVARSTPRASTSTATVEAQAGRRQRAQIVAGVELDPRTVHVTIPLFTNRETRTLPVNPVVTGTPAQGFRIASVAADPLVVSVEGDADQLAALTRPTRRRCRSRAPRATSSVRASPSPCRRAWSRSAQETVQRDRSTSRRDGDPHLLGRHPARRPRARARLRAVGDAGAAHPVRPGVRPRPARLGADRRRRQRRGPRARAATSCRWSHRCPRP